MYTRINFNSIQAYHDLESGVLDLGLPARAHNLSSACQKLVRQSIQFYYLLKGQSDYFYQASKFMSSFQYDVVSLK